MINGEKYCEFCSYGGREGERGGLWNGRERVREGGPEGRRKGGMP